MNPSNSDPSHIIFVCVFNVCVCDKRRGEFHKREREGHVYGQRDIKALRCHRDEAVAKGCRCRPFSG